MSRLLLVEDNDSSRYLVHAILRRRGYDLVDAGTLAEARRRLDEGAFALIILDLRLPDGNALEFVRDLRARPATSELPILAVSASVFPPERDAALQAGCNRFLGKPVLPLDLIEAVVGLLPTA